MPTSPTQPLKRWDAVQALGGNAALFTRLEKAGWIKGTAGLYDLAEIQEAWKRLRKEGEPKLRK